MHTGERVIANRSPNQDTIMTFASQHNGVCADPTDVSFAPIAGSDLMVLNKSVPSHSVMAFWPSAIQLLESGKPAAALTSPPPSPAPERTAAQCVNMLASQALKHQAVQHPYLAALASGELPDTRWALQDFARQYYAYSAHFPRYLTAVISKLENPSHRSGADGEPHRGIRPV